MNDLVSKIKNFDYKSFALKHGEKIGLSVVILFTLMALYQTAWGTIKRTPEELVKLAQTAMTNLTTTPWPEDQKQLFVVTDLKKEAKDMEVSMKIDKLDFNTKIFEPLYPRMQPAEEPKLSQVASLIVDEGTAPLPLNAATTSPDGTAPPQPGNPAGGNPANPEMDLLEENPDLVTNIPKDPAANQPKPGNVVGEAQGGVPGEFNQAQMRQRRGMNEDGPAAGKPNRRGAAKGGRELDMGGVPAAAGAQPVTPAVSGRGVRFASIRGVFPFEQQARLMAEALHISLARAADQVEIEDFEIQRQRRVPAPAEPWSGPWETLDYSTATDVLDEVTNYAPDVVRTEVTNDVITMALPERILGTWYKSRVGHPQLEEYLLDEDTKRDAEMKLNQELLDQARRMNLDVSKKRRRPGRGFSGKQRDLNQVRKALQTEAMQNPEVEEEMMRRRGPAAPEPTRPGMGNNRTGLTKLIGSDPFAIPKLILFRYFDFTVEPGECYRYRVRLVFNNPNYRKSLEKVVSAEVAQSETLKSDWSEPSAQVFIKPDVHVFLTGVPRVRKSRGDGGLLDVFAWDPQFGTLVHAQLRQYFGQAVGGPVKAEVLDPFARTLGDREIVMRTRQIFVDSVSIPPLPLSENPDLQLDSKQLESLEKAGAFEQAVTVNHAGELVELVPLAAVAERQKAERDEFILKKYLAHWRAPKDDPAAAAKGGGLDGPELDSLNNKRSAKGAAKGKNAKKGPEVNPLKFSGPNDGPGGSSKGRGRGAKSGGGKSR